MLSLRSRKKVKSISEIAFARAAEHKGTTPEQGVAGPAVLELSGSWTLYKASVSMQLILRSGGQTGVDRAALDLAVRLGRPYGGWCPRGGWAEDFPTAPGLLRVYPHLRETPSPLPEQRTAWNVRDSHATLILSRGNELERSPGSMQTRQYAELIFLRPCRVVDISQSAAVETTRDWLTRLAGTLGSEELWLNIAGPRESQAPGIYAEASRFLAQLLSPDCLDGDWNARAAR